ncbi:MAG: 30S ribosomal protein S17 [Planctomycetaceae bacterium]
MKRVLRGTVTSDKRDKTLRVDIERRFRHRKYGKIVRSRLGCQVHDPDNTGRMGDLVEIVESQPISKTKRWQLVRVIQAASDASVAAGELDAAAAKQAEQVASES